MAGNKNPKQSMKETLSDAFARSDIWNPQEYIFFWAIEEGLNRVPKLRDSYRFIRTASKEYKCVRNCAIHPGDKYFAAKNSKHTGKKLCVSCMAMILYFLEVWDMPTYLHDYWDNEKHRPHLDENSNHWKTLVDIMEK